MPLEGVKNVILVSGFAPPPPFGSYARLFFFSILIDNDVME